MIEKSLIFTHRERLILHLHNRNVPNAKIARELGIHRGTVQRVLEKAKAKLDEVRTLARSLHEGELLDTVDRPPRPAA